MILLPTLAEGRSTMTSTAGDDPYEDPAQVEWDRTTALDSGLAPEDLDVATATGGDPDELPADDDDIPRSDLPGWTDLPETQGTDPLDAELGDEGQGDLAPEDL
jgi:hypothetical protein